MDWNSLKIFLAIAEGGSLAAAVKKLGVNHSTMFRRLNSPNNIAYRFLPQYIAEFNEQYLEIRIVKKLGSCLYCCILDILNIQLHRHDL